MLYTEWGPIYKKIVNDLDLNFKKDKDAAILLDSLLENKKKNDIKKIEKIIHRKEVIIFGAGPSLEKSINNNRNKIEKSIKISVDGSTSALLKNKIKPDLIVTDLDGYVPDQIQSNVRGSFAVIHAHGDNIKALEKYIKSFEGEILGTTQMDPSNFKNLHNFGGFTDGDRAVYLADSFNAKKIFLIGFDFKGEIGKYSFSKNKDKDMKIRKLKWCKILLNTIMEKNKNIEFL